MTFWKCTREMIAHSPLMLSETDDPKNISLNRVITFCAALALAISPILVLIIWPDRWKNLMDIWPDGLAFLAAQTAGNLFIKHTKVKIETTTRARSLKDFDAEEK